MKRKSANLKKLNRSAFTMVEVAMVISISTLMMIAFVATIAGRVGAQRYKDATTAFADFIRGVYSEVINVENSRSGQIKVQNDYCTLAGQIASIEPSTNPGANLNPDESYPGRSGCAIYGKLISFGEENKNGDYTIYVYDVIGRASDFSNPIVGASTTIDELRVMHADVLALVQENEATNKLSLSTAALQESYDPSWGARAEDPDGNIFHGTLMIVRAPSSGAVRTFFLNRTLPIQELLNNASYKGMTNNVGTRQSMQSVVNNVNANLANYMHYEEDLAENRNAFVFQDVDICINSEDLFSGFSVRNNIRIKADGHNSSAVEFVETDNTGAGGNACR